MNGIEIVGAGSHLPGEPVDNHALSRVMDTSDAWIAQRAGVRQRHFAAAGEGASDLAVPAAQAALRDAGLQPEAVDYVIFATMTPDQPIPGPGAMFAAKLGIAGVPTLDIRQQCAAVPFAVQIADALLKSGAASTVLFVAAETHAGFMPWRDWQLLREGVGEVDPEDFARATRHRGMAILFGDGAGALVLRRSERAEVGLLGVELCSDGQHADALELRAGGFCQQPALSAEMLAEELDIPRMKGRELFRRAVTGLPAMVRTLCEREHVALSDIDLVVAHQANARINEAVRQALDVPPEKMPSNIDRCANTSGATIPILLSELRDAGRLRPGQLVCLAALGAGLHLGVCLLRT